MECFLEPKFLYFWRSAGQFCVSSCLECCHLPSTSLLCRSQCLLPLPSLHCPSILHLGQIVPLYPRLSAKWDPHEYKLPITGSHRETGTLDLTRLCALQRLAVIEFGFLFVSVWNKIRLVSTLESVARSHYDRLTSKYAERPQSIEGQSFPARIWNWPPVWVADLTQLSKMEIVLVKPRENAQLPAVSHHMVPRGLLCWSRAGTL